MQTMVPTAGGVQGGLVVLQVPPVAGADGPLPVESPELSDELVAGAKAGPWIIERELGRGGMGAVYGVVHEDIGKRAALKVMHRRLVNSTSIERILLEARVVNQVGHPNIIDIFETGTLEDGRPYILMERLDGASLGQRADKGKILPTEVINILLQCCDALIAAHAAGIVHRDLKTDNIFLIDNPEAPTCPKVKLLDWGIAKVIANDVRNTSEGQLVGTPQYLSPEQARGAVVSAQTDVYSLGVTAYELFLEQLPFEAETAAEIMVMHLRSTPPPPSDIWPEIPPALERLLLAMLAKDPNGRPTMVSVALTLERVRDAMLIECKRIAADSGATVAPSVRPSKRWSSPRGYAETQLATWREPKRRWKYVVGSLAVAASAMMFIISRDTDSAAATNPPHHSAAFTERSLPSPLPSALALRADDVVAVSIESPPEPVAVHRVDGGHRASSRNTAHATARTVPVKPHRMLAADPNGTVDPYQ